MQKVKLLAAAVLCASLIPLSAAYAQGMSKSELKTHKARISEEYKADKEACHAHAGNAKDICEQEAKAAEKKALANVGMGQHMGTTKNKAASEKLEADYKVALEKCNALAGDTKASCVAAANVTFGKK